MKFFIRLFLYVVVMLIGGFVAAAVNADFNDSLTLAITSFLVIGSVSIIQAVVA